MVDQEENSQQANLDATVHSSASSFMAQVNVDELGSTQKGFITSVRILEENLELCGEALLREFADMFPPASLFSKELCELPAAYTEVRNFLDSRGANMQQHSSRRIMMTLAHNIYIEQEDKDAAVAIVTEIIAAGRRMRSDLSRLSEQRTPSTPRNNTSQAFSSSAMDKIAHNVAMRLKERDSKFSGGLGESWMEFVDEYLQICRDYSLSPTQKLQYIHNLLSGDAKRHYLDKIDGYATSFQQAVEMIEREYNSPVRQARVKNYLNQLRLSVLQAEGIEESAALSKLYRIITKLSRQAKSSHRGDAHKLEFLRNAVVGASWSREPLSRVATHNLSFQQLYGELEAALQLEKEAKHAALRDSLTTAKIQSLGHDDEIPGILFTGQTRYARHPSSVGQQQKGISFASRKDSNFDPLTITGCFNCDDPRHLVKDCTVPLNVAKAASRRLEYYAKKKQTKDHAVHLVLADLCNQLDSDNHEANQGDGEAAIHQVHSDREIFENLLCSLSTLGVNMVTINEDKDVRPIGDDATHSNDNAGSSDENSFDVTVFEFDDKDPEVYLVHEEITKGNCIPFLGACIDTGAQKSVIGVEQARAYCQFMNVQYEPQRMERSMSFKFGNTRHTGLGELEVRMPVDNTYFLSIWIQVVDVNVPLLLGLDFLDAFGMNVDASRDILRSEERGWSFDLVRKFGHLYVEWDAGNYYTAKELKKIHRHFFHPDTGRLYAMLKRADAEETMPEVMGNLETITKECDICQSHMKEPRSFRVALPPEKVVFNKVVLMDRMTLSGKPVLHMVDRDTKFSVAEFLQGESAKEAWNVYMSAWATTYIGFSDEIHADQGPQFRSREFQTYAADADIKLTLSGVESHNSLGVGERYHDYLRKIYKKTRDEHPNISLEYSLKLAVKAMNDTAGSNGLVPTLLVFGVMPRIPLRKRHLPGMVDRMKAMDAARSEVSKLIARDRLKKAVKSNVPAAADKMIQIGEQVLVYKEKPINQWIGPFHVRDVNAKTVFVDMNGGTSQLSIDKVKVYVKPEIEEDEGEVSSTRTLSAAQQSLEEMFRDGPLEELFRSPRAEEDPISTKEFFVDFQSYLTEVIDSTNPISMSERFQKAKEQEVEVLNSRGTWEIVKKSDVPTGANVLGGRFVLALKNVGTENEQDKARFVAQGFADKEKDFLIHNVTSVRQSSVRVLLSFAANKGYRMYSHDVRQAYTQSAEPRTREIYLQPKRNDVKFFGIQEDEVLKLKKPMYGTTDAGDYWDVTIVGHIKVDLEMEPMTGDGSLYAKFEDPDKAAEGLLGMLVDDGLLTGSENFQRLTEKTLERFESRPREWDSFDFYGLSISSGQGDGIKICQTGHIKRLPLLEKEVSFATFRSIRGALAWISHTRPDIACLVNKAAQVTEATLSPAEVKMVNDCIKTLKKEPRLGLTFSPFGC